jgi:hypothetical protein
VIDDLRSCLWIYQPVTSTQVRSRVASTEKCAESTLLSLYYQLCYYESTAAVFWIRRSRLDAGTATLFYFGSSSSLCMLRTPIKMVIGGDSKGTCINSWLTIRCSLGCAGYEHRSIAHSYYGGSEISGPRCINKEYITWWQTLPSIPIAHAWVA